MSIDVSRLKIDLEEKEHWRRTISVTVPAGIVEEEHRRAADKLASRLKLKGFRKGRIPRSVVEQRYGQALRQETLDRLINDAFQEALQVRSLRPISEGQLDDLQYEPDEDLTFAISFDIQPEIELARLGGFAVERPAAAVDEESLNEVLDRLRERNSVWHPTEGPPENGDLVQVRIEQLADDAAETANVEAADGHSGDGESTDGPPTDGAAGDAEDAREYEFVLGQGEALADIEAALESMEAGETKEVTVTFPDDFPDEERQGEKRRLRIGLRGRKVQELPALDAEFASSIGDFESMEDLEETIRHDLQREANDESEKTVRGRLLDLIVDANPFEVPDSMVDGYIDQVFGETAEMPDEEVARAKATLRPQAERAVKRALVIERIADTQALRATEDEMDGRVEEIAAKNDTTPAKVYASLQKAGRLSSLEREITEEKVFEFLESQSKITEES